MISKNFSVNEVQFSTYASQHNIDNTLPSCYHTNAQLLAVYILEPIRAHFGKPFSPESWYRCERVNSAVGGAKNSQHLIAQAADIIVPETPLMTVAEYIRDDLDFDQVILELGGKGWVHVSYNKGNNRKQVLTNKGDGKYLEGLCSE
jgi:hypothetical protein